eukprot:COSAG01_NODE_8591_length_2725_cov_55.670602_1_plen_173_part_10
MFNYVAVRDPKFTVGVPCSYDAFFSHSHRRALYYSTVQKKTAEEPQFVCRVWAVDHLSRPSRGRLAASKRRQTECSHSSTASTRRTRPSTHDKQAVCMPCHQLAACAAAAAASLQWGLAVAAAAGRRRAPAKAKGGIIEHRRQQPAAADPNGSRNKQASNIVATDAAHQTDTS